MVFRLLVVLALAHAGFAKVSPDFSDCRGQFYASTPPVGFTSLPDTMSPICQMYEKYNNPFFASLYHKKNRSPLYSAYILDSRRGDVTGTSPTFRLEPQLVNTSLPKQMMLQPATEKAIRNLRLNGTPIDLIKGSQAINSDYFGSNYHKGHLNPNADHPDGPSQKATYTLTNVAPMSSSLNSGAWRNNEKRVRDIAATCDKMYVVTGVVPGNNWISVKEEQRVNIPSYIWSGYCCLGYKRPGAESEKNRRRTGAALAENNANKVQDISLSSLQNHLKSLLRVTVTLFQNNCSEDVHTNLNQF